MTKSSQKLSRERGSQLKRRRSTSDDRSWIWLVGGGAVIMIVLTVLLLTPKQIPLVDGVVTYSNLSREHSGAPQTYPQTPPVGGAHSATLQNCGIYDQPIRNENAVHSLEHGAVWIAYRPDLPVDAVETLHSLARGKDHVLLAPYPGLPRPVVATAWELQLSVDDAADSRLVLFVARYERGPQTPERGAVCRGGVGTPIGG